MKTTLSPLQAFKAMRRFLEDYYYYTSADDIGSLLSYTQLFPEGGTYDPIFWEDWLKIIDNKKEISAFEAFNAMKKFLEMHASRISSKEIKALLDTMKINNENVLDQETWQKWNLSVKSVL